MSTWDRPVIHAADLHMDPHIWVGRPEIIGDARFALAQIENLCLEHDANLILAGDVTNSRRGYPRPTSVLQETVESLIKKGNEVGYICGNHDPESWVATSPGLIERVHHLTAGQFCLGEHRIYGLDYIASRVRLREELSNVPEAFDVLVCHQRFQEAFGWDTYHCSMDDVPENIKLVLAGDIHQQWDARMPDGRRLLYPGCPYLRRVNETDDHGVWLVQPDLSVTWLPLKARPVLRLLLESNDDISKACHVIREAAHVARDDLPSWPECQVPLVLLRFYPHETPGAVEAIKDVFRDGAHIIPLPQEREHEQALQDFQAEQSGGGFMGRMRGFLGREVDQKESPVLFDALDTFLSGTDVHVMVKEIGQRLGVPDELLVELTGKR